MILDTFEVPPGWATWLGLQGNSRYYNYTLSANGRAETRGDGSNYLCFPISILTLSSLLADSQGLVLGCIEA